MIKLRQKLKQTALAGLVAASAMYGAGCGTLLSKHSYNIPIYSNPSGKDVTIFDSANQNQVAYMGKTPCVFQSPRGLHKYKIHCGNSMIPRDSRDNYSASANLLFGPIGIVGCIIDLSTGSNYEISESPIYFNFSNSNLKSSSFDNFKSNTTNIQLNQNSKFNEFLSSKD